MKTKPTQSQRLITALSNIAIFIFVAYLMRLNLRHYLIPGADESIWFASGMLLLIMATYVTEPYFTAPTDTLANSVGMGLMLFATKNRTNLIGFWVLVGYAFLMFVISIVSILVRKQYPKANKILYLITSKLGSSKFMYSAIYILSAFSFFKDDSVKLITAIFLWIGIIVLNITGKTIEYISRFIKTTRIKTDDADIGSAVKCNNPNLYTAEIAKSEENMSVFFGDKADQLVMIRGNKETYQIGIVTACKVLIDKLWIEIMLLNDDTEFIEISAKEITKDGKQVLLRKDIGSVRIVSIQELPEGLKTRVLDAKQYKESEALAGFVLENSNINVIRFSILPKAMGCIAAGTVVTARINGKNILFQVFDGITAQAKNDGNSSNGYIYAIARKLGHYDYTKAELESDKWLPNMNEPVYLMNCSSPTNDKLESIANDSIGFLPGTDMRIPLVDINALVTHNTAILGILGIGKSCLSFELIKRMVDANIKVICIDITNQYISETDGLPRYIVQNDILVDFDTERLDELKKNERQRATRNSPTGWGNLENYKRLVSVFIGEFLDGDKKVLILNPNAHCVTKAASAFNIEDNTESSVVEKVKMISEAILKYYSAKTLTTDARCCVVYEEAHSLIPEWNSVVESSDSAHCNGTARVILQGRKYGLGCLAITQRTANISKSILNQCNTMFAMRAFDDTSKTFLENYIGKDYVNILPQLEERQAIVIGRGMRLKQPVVVRLNDKKYVQKKETE